MPQVWLKSKRVWAMVGMVGLLAFAFWGAAQPSMRPAGGRPETDPLIGHWACVKKFGLLGEAQLDVRLKFSSDHSLAVELTAMNGLGTSPEGGLGGRVTWQRQAGHQLLLTVENLTYGGEGLGSGKRARRVKKWCNKLVELVEVGDRKLVLANLFRSGQDVFMRLPD